LALEPPAPLLRVADRTRGCLYVAEGEVVSILGVSGAGKTQWIRSLLGLGEAFDVAEVLGAPVDKAVAAQEIGWVSERAPVMLSETVIDNVLLPVGKTVTPARAYDALDLVGLAHRANDGAASLNPAEQRRVAFARALAREAALVVIDGPLDAVIWPVVPLICKQYPAVKGLLVTQSCIDEVTAKATSVAVLHEGAIIAHGPLEVLRCSPKERVRKLIAMMDQ
jgi:ABC-type multidrug transport system ATPase subunit